MTRFQIKIVFQAIVPLLSWYVYNWKLIRVLKR